MQLKLKFSVLFEMYQSLMEAEVEKMKKEPKDDIPVAIETGEAARWCKTSLYPRRFTFGNVQVPLEMPPSSFSVLAF